MDFTDQLTPVRINHTDLVLLVVAVRKATLSYLILWNVSVLVVNDILDSHSYASVYYNILSFGIGYLYKCYHI